MIHVKKRHNTNYGTLLKCYPWSKKDLWQHKCPLLSRIANYTSSGCKFPTVCMCQKLWKLAGSTQSYCKNY